MNETNPPPIRIVIADKSPLVQTGLASFLGGDKRFHHVATFSDGLEFMNAVNKLQFNIGITGWDMPGVNGRNILQEARKQAPGLRIIIYTGNSAPDIPYQTMQLGGAGFCSKSEPMSILLDTIIAVSEGRMVFPFMDINSPGSDPLGVLTGREKELLAALSRGNTNVQISKELDISLNTVKFHLKNLFSKLEVRNRAQAVSCYLKSFGGISGAEN